MKSTLLDTSFLSSLFNKKDVNYSLAVEMAKDIKDTDIIIPVVVFAELASNLKNKVLRDLTIEIGLEMAEEIPDLNNKNLKKYLQFVKSLPNRLTTLDSIILFLANEYNSQLITFDKKLEKVFKKRLSLQQ